MPDPVPTTRRASTVGEILLAVQTRLRNRVAGATEANCFLSLFDNPPAVATGWLIVIQPNGGTFDAGALDGGGREAARQTRSLTVSLYATTAIDQAGKHQQFLTDASLGLIERWGEILSALTQFDPVDADGAGILCEPMNPTDDAPIIAERQARAGWRQDFSFMLEWNLGD